MEKDYHNRPSATPHGGTDVSAFMCLLVFIIFSSFSCQVRKYTKKLIRSNSFRKKSLFVSIFSTFRRKDGIFPPQMRRSKA